MYPLDIGTESYVHDNATNDMRIGANELGAAGWHVQCTKLDSLAQGSELARMSCLYAGLLPEVVGAWQDACLTMGCRKRHQGAVPEAETASGGQKQKKRKHRKVNPPLHWQLKQLPAL